MRLNLHRPVISTDKAALWISLLSIAFSAVTLIFTMSLQKAQKEVDTLVEFRQLYLTQSRMLNFYECVQKRTPDIVVNAGALSALRSDMEKMRKTMIENKGKDLGYDEQKAVVVSGLMIFSEAETQISRLVASATEVQIKTLKEYCRFGEGGW